MYIDINTGTYPLSEEDIRLQHTNVSFAVPFEPPINYKWVSATPIPQYNPVLEVYTETTPVLTDSGNWEVRWIVQSKFQTYTDSSGVIHTKESQEQEALLKAEQDKYTQTVQTYENAIDNHLDLKAKEKGYDSRITCALRAGFPGPFQSEGLAFAQWMDSCYTYTYQVLEDVKQGRRAQPTVEELLNELPVLTWPTNQGAL